MTTNACKFPRRRWWIRLVVNDRTWWIYMLGGSFSVFRHHWRGRTMQVAFYITLPRLDVNFRLYPADRAPTEGG